MSKTDQREESMKRSAALSPIALALGAMTVVPGAGAQGPTLITACQTISQGGSYELANSLVNPIGSCLVITTDDVTIDLAGFGIGVDPRRGGKAIVALPSTSGLLFGLAVRNGSIAGSVDLSSADGSIVEGLLVQENGPSGIGTGITASGIVKGNTVGARFGFVTGISATGTVTGNYAVNNGTGIKIGQGSTVIGNTATHNCEGIVAECPSNLTDNTAVDNAHNLVLDGTGCNNTNNVAP
jgi:hypothetical protein